MISLETFILIFNVFAKVQIYNETNRTEKEDDTDMSVFLVVK